MRAEVNLEELLVTDEYVPRTPAYHLVLVLFVGLLVRAPWTARKFTNDPDDEVVTQRDAE